MWITVQPQEAPIPTYTLTLGTLSISLNYAEALTLQSRLEAALALPPIDYE
jgi:hypothetical protein